MSYLVWLVARYWFGFVAAVLALGMLSQVMGQWAIPVVLLMGFAWLFRSQLLRLAAPAVGMPASKAELPNPLTNREYRLAGVDPLKCSKCVQPLKTVGYYFGLSGVPTVYCPSCHSKATDPSRDKQYDQFFANLTAKIDRRKPT